MSDVTPELISAKNTNELEQLVTQLLAAMRKSKLTSEPIYAALQDMERELGESRRSRFDKTQSDYAGY